MRNKQMIVKVTALLTLLVLGYFGVKAGEVKQVIQGLDEQIKQAEEKLGKEQRTYKELQKERERMDSLEYIEQMAREKLGMVKQDDIIFKEK